MTTNLRDRVAADRVVALLKTDTTSRTALDAVWSQIELLEKSDKRSTKGPLDDTETLAAVTRTNKQYSESIAAFQDAAAKEQDPKVKAEREAKVAQLQAFQAVLTPYLPTLMSRDEISSALRELLLDNPITDPRQVGKLVGLFNKTYPKKADNNVVKEIAESLITPQTNGI